jgi:micrococcal nuclease
MGRFAMYSYAATLRRVVDGDTVDFDVDLGFCMTAAIRFRVLGIDTPELRGGTDESKALARDAKAFVEDCLVDAERIIIRTEKADSFGRWLAEIDYLKPGQTDYSNLSEDLLNAGLAAKR